MESQMKKEMTTKKTMVMGEPMRVRFSCTSSILLLNRERKDLSMVRNLFERRFANSPG